MIIKDWDDMPRNMKNESVRHYYNILSRKCKSLLVKRIFDVIVSVLLLIVLSPLFLIISVLIKADSKGPIMFRQIRVTKYGEKFRIYKFRTMVNNADKIGTQVTTLNDARITKVGGILRKFRLDEIPQLLNIISGDMSFVGTRPEVVKYVEKYTDEMMATLLLPAGVTSVTSLKYKDEEMLLANYDDADKIYIEKILPLKMKYNLEYIENFSFINEIKTMVKTFLVIFFSGLRANKIKDNNIVEDKIKKGNI